MPKFKDIPIKRKLTAIIMVASTVALLLACGGFLTYELVTFRHKMSWDLSSLAGIIGKESASALSFKDADRAKEILNCLRGERHIIGAALYDDEGHLLASYPDRKNRAAHFSAQPQPESLRFDANALTMYHEIHLDGDFLGTLYLQSDLEEMHERFVRYGIMIGVLMLVSLVVTLILSNFLQRVISRPIFHLAEAARYVSQQKNYAIRATKQGNDELGQLIDGFNEMLEQIQRRDSELLRNNDKLELRVEERTRDLQAEIVERSRAETALQQQFVRISLLNQITQAIADRQDTESILHVVLRQLEDHVGLDLGMVALFDSHTRNLNVAALRVKNTSLAEKLELSEGSVVHLSQSGFDLCEKSQTVYYPDTIKSQTDFIEKLAVTGWRSAMAVPLIVEDKLFGILLVARLRPNGFGSADGEFLRMLSQHVALSAHQARLYQNLEEAYHELRETQATVLQQERLKALGQMASGIAHDINNALSPVVGFADILLQGDFGLNASGKKYLKHIQTAGQDIAHIVARLREFYRKHDEAESLQLLNLNALAEQVIDMTRPRWRDIPQSNGVTIEVKTDFTPGLPLLAGIESEIREVITNLVLNAIDAMPEGGRITLHTALQQSDASPADTDSTPRQLALEITDTGVGMNEETKKRCLEPFFSTKGKRGTGLGLAMVYGVVQRHEGNIEIISEPGRGTTIRIVLPVRTQLCVRQNQTDANSEILPMQILCIDDEPLLRELMKEILELDGHDVKVSDGGQSGLDEFRLARQKGRPFDLIITDLGMPYIDGRQVAKTIKHESPSTPVVMLTGWGAFMKEEDTQPEQVDGVLSKPPHSKELRDVLRRFQPKRDGVASMVN